MAEETKNNDENIAKSAPSKLLRQVRQAHCGPAEDEAAAWWQPAIFIFLKFSAWIFIPVVIALYLGRWLDKKYSTEPFLFLATIGFAFLISMLGIIRGSAREYKKIEEEERIKKENK